MDKSKRERLIVWSNAILTPVYTMILATFAAISEDAEFKAIALFGLATFGTATVISMADLIQIRSGKKTDRERIADLEARVAELEGRDRE